MSKDTSRIILKNIDPIDMIDQNAIETKSSGLIRLLSESRIDENGNEINISWQDKIREYYHEFIENPHINAGAMSMKDKLTREITAQKKYIKQLESDPQIANTNLDIQTQLEQEEDERFKERQKLDGELVNYDSAELTELMKHKSNIRAGASKAARKVLGEDYVDSLLAGIQKEKTTKKRKHELLNLRQKIAEEKASLEKKQEQLDIILIGADKQSLSERIDSLDNQIGILESQREKAEKDENKPEQEWLDKKIERMENKLENLEVALEKAEDFQITDKEEMLKKATNYLNDRIKLELKKETSLSPIVKIISTQEDLEKKLTGLLRDKSKTREEFMQSAQNVIKIYYIINSNAQDIDPNITPDIKKDLEKLFDQKHQKGLFAAIRKLTNAVANKIGLSSKNVGIKRVMKKADQNWQGKISDAKGEATTKGRS